MTKDFYDEYFAVLDLTAEFYLETVAWVFQEARLAKGELTYRGRPIDPKAIRRTALLTVEGERDDICAMGQTAAAHDLCKGLKPYMKRHHMQAGVGHYGVFSGKRWETQVYPHRAQHDAGERVIGRGPRHRRCDTRVPSTMSAAPASMARPGTSAKNRKPNSTPHTSVM